jgi:anti-anti-sigma regulatory factor
MLRITTHECNDSVTFQVEGRLAGPWVETLQECWRARNDPRAVEVDLRAVTFVDAAGKALLAEMCGQNAKLIAGDCLMKALVAEIEQSSGKSR